MGERLLTGDGEWVGVGDRVWAANHVPWVISRIGTLPGARADGPLWAYMDADPGYPPQADLDDRNYMGEKDFATYFFKEHPADGRCEWAGCRRRPWGAR